MSKAREPFTIHEELIVPSFCLKKNDLQWHLLVNYNSASLIRTIVLWIVVGHYAEVTILGTVATFIQFPNESVRI